MIGHTAGYRRLDGIIWAIVAAAAVLELLAVAFGGFTLVLRSYAAPVATCAILMLAARYYGARRNDPKLASALESTAQLAAFAAVAAPLSYTAASAGLPMYDAAFDAMDRALGFDWSALLALMERWRDFNLFMQAAYTSLTLQMTAVVLLLAFTGRLAWLRVYTFAFFFTALIAIALSAVLPAQGVWLHYGLPITDTGVLPVSSSSWPVFLGLRDGSVRELMAVGAEGIITFPSLHSALAVILIAAFWPVPVARWIGAVLNISMLAATPIEGSHYLVDVLAGVAIAVLCLGLARALVTRLTAHPATANGAVSPAPASGLAASSQ